MASATQAKGPLEQQAANLPVRVYTPESALRHPGQLLREMFRDLWASRELAWRLFVRDTRARYRQSLLGYVWAFVPAIVSTATFVLLNQSGILGHADPRIPYPVFVMVGTLLWQVFADAIMSPNKAVASAKAMLSKINFPREAIILAGIYDVIFNLLLRVTLLIPVLAYYKVVPPPAALLSVFGIAGLLCLGLMIGLLLTPVGLLYTDVSQALTLGLTFWMLFTPVAYLPPSKGALALVTKFNPVTPLVVATRDYLIMGDTGQLWASVYVVSASVVFLFVGWVLYRLAMPILVERMGN